MGRLFRYVSQSLDLTRPLWMATVIALLVFPLPNLSLPPRVIVVVVAIAWLLAGWADHVWWRFTPLDVPWLIWLLLIPVTLWATAVPDLTHAALKLLAAQGIAFWMMVIWVRSPRRAAWATAGLLGAALTLAVLGLFWMQWPSGYLFPVPADLKALREHYSLPVQESVNKNVLAGVLVPLWCLALGTIPALRGRWRWPMRFLDLLGALTIGGMVALSQSRGSWVAAVVGTYVLIALRWRLMWAGLAAVPLGVWALHTQGRLLPLLNTALALRNGGSLVGRVELWSRALYAAQDFVFTGIGMGTFPRVIPLLYPLFLYGPNAEIPHAHNLFLQIAVDLGIFGLLAFLAMILVTGLLVGKGIAAARRTGDNSSAWILRGASAGLVAALAHGMVDAVTWNIRPAFLVWAIWGLAVGLALTCVERGRGGRNENLATPAQNDTLLHNGR